MFGPPPTGPQPQKIPRQPPHQYRPGPRYANSGCPTPDLSRFDTPIVNSWSDANHQTRNIPSNRSSDHYSTLPHWRPQVKQDLIITPYHYSVGGLPTVLYPSNPSNPIHHTRNVPSNGSPGRYSTLPHYLPQVRHDQINTPYPYSVGGLAPVLYPANRSYLPGTSGPNRTSIKALGYPIQLSGPSHSYASSHDQRYPLVNGVYTSRIGRSGRGECSASKQWPYHEHPKPAPAPVIRSGPFTQSVFHDHPIPGTENWVEAQIRRVIHQATTPAPVIRAGPSIQSVLHDRPFPGTEDSVDAHMRRVMNRAILGPRFTVRQPNISERGSGQSTLLSSSVPHPEERQNPSSLNRGHQQVRMQPAVDQVEQVSTRQAKPLKPAVESFLAPYTSLLVAATARRLSPQVFTRKPEPLNAAAKPSQPPSLSVAATAKGQSSQAVTRKPKPLNPAVKPFQPRSHAVAATAREQSLALESSSSPSGDGLQLPNLIESSLVGAMNKVSNTGPAEPNGETQKLVYLVRAGEVPNFSDGQLHKRHHQGYDRNTRKAGFDPELTERGIAQCTRLNEETRGGMQRFAQLLLVSPVHRVAHVWHQLISATSSYGDGTRGLPELAERLFETEPDIKPLSRVDWSLAVIRSGPSSVPSWLQKRATKSAIKAVYDRYPALDTHDIFFGRRVCLNWEHTSERAEGLLRSLWEAPELVIVVVSHQELLRRMVGNQSEWDHCQVRPFTLHKDENDEPYLREISDED